MTRHLTAGEKRARASAAAAIARAQARIRPKPAEHDDIVLGALYPSVTPARARQIRHEIQETTNDR